MAGLSDLLGGLMGNDAGSEEMAKSLGLSRSALEELKKIYVPTIEEQKVNLVSPELAGLLEASNVGDTALSGVSADPRLKQAQMKALEEMAGLSEQGLGVQDQAAFNQLRRQAGSEAQAQQASILQNAASQGTLDSGNALMAQLNGAQSQANRLQQGAEAQASAAAQARREAINSYGNMSSQMANQDYSNKANTASAKDAIAKFNAQNTQGANQFNINNKQDVANTAANTKNQQTMYNTGLIQQKFQNDLSKATGVAGQTNNLASAYANQGTAKAQGQAAMNGAILGAAGDAATAYIKKP